jgi:hypothetical protein
MDSMYTNAGVEKNNDAAKHAYYSSNRHDPCGEVLQIESRQEELESILYVSLSSRHFSTLPAPTQKHSLANARVLTIFQFSFPFM